MDYRWQGAEICCEYILEKEIYFTNPEHSHKILLEEVLDHTGTRKSRATFLSPCASPTKAKWLLISISLYLPSYFPANQLVPVLNSLNDSSLQPQVHSS